MPIGVIIQARTSSKRLPKKILLELPYNSGVTVLENIISRAEKVESIDKVIVATSINSEDDIIESLCNKVGAFCFRGDLYNVLERFYYAASRHGLDTIVRLTADNPCYDYRIIEKSIESHIENHNDYTITEDYPLGTNVEIISFSALEACFRKASCEYEKEHVTPYIYKTKPEEFKIVTLPASVNRAGLRLTLDTEDDYLLQCAVFDHLYSLNSCFGLDEIISLFNKKPWLEKINNKAYQKKICNSLEEEIVEAMRLLEFNGLRDAKQYFDTLLEG